MKNPFFHRQRRKAVLPLFCCGAHGNAIDFLMNYDRLEFVESIEELATLYGLEVPYESGSGPSQLERHQRQSLYQLMTGLRDFFSSH